MANLSDEEKRELLRATSVRPGPRPPATFVGGEPPRRLLTAREYIEFASFASRFDRSRKPVAFGGTQWKL